MSRPGDQADGETAAGSQASADGAPGREGERDVSLPRPVGPGLERVLLASRTLTLIPVIVLVLATAGDFVYGTALFVRSVQDVVSHPFPLGNKAGALLLIIDLFLVGATTFIAALGFYELFIGVSAGVRSRLPGWLVMRDLDDLKARVVSMLILVTAASFVDDVVDFHGGHDILYFGIAAAVFIVALTAYLRFGAGGRDGS